MTAKHNPRPQRAEILTAGSVDVINTGQVNASARLIRLYIGEQGRWAIPLSIYSGVSSGNFGHTRAQSNDILVANLINPLSGITNISIDGVRFFQRDSLRVSNSGLFYQIGERLLTGIRADAQGDPFSGLPINFLNTYGSAGLYLQTGAWDRSNTRALGVAWFAVRYIVCHSDPKILRQVFPMVIGTGVYHGYSIGWGVEITNFVNIKLVYYNYVRRPETEHNFPLYQFSFNYSLRK